MKRTHKTWAQAQTQYLGAVRWCCYPLCHPSSQTALTKNGYCATHCYKITYGAPDLSYYYLCLTKLLKNEATNRDDRFLYSYPILLYLTCFTSLFLPWPHFLQKTFTLSSVMLKFGTGYKTLYSNSSGPQMKPDGAKSWTLICTVTASL